MKTKDLVKIGIPAGRCSEAAKQILQRAAPAKRSMAAVLDDLGRVAAEPAAFRRRSSATRGWRSYCSIRPQSNARLFGGADAPYRIWGENLDLAAVQQLKNACALPVCRGRRAHAGRPCRLRTADRRRAGDRERHHSLCGRRRHRLPDEADGARPAGTHPHDPSGAADARDRARDPFRDRCVVRDAPAARGHGRRLARDERDRTAQGSRVGAARHERERQPLRRVRPAHGVRRGGGALAWEIPRAPQPLRQPRIRRADRRSLQPARARLASRTAQGALASGVAGSRRARRARSIGRRWS